MSLRSLLCLLLLLPAGWLRAAGDGPLATLPFPRTDARVQPYPADAATLIVLAGRWELRRTESPNALQVIDLESGASQRLPVPLGAATALPCGDLIALYCDESQVAVLIDPAQPAIVSATPMPPNTRRCTPLAADEHYLAVSAGLRSWLCPWGSAEAIELPTDLQAVCPSPLPDYWLLLSADNTLGLYEPAKQAAAELATVFPDWRPTAITLLERHAPHGYLVRVAPPGQPAYLARLDAQLRRHGRISLGEPIGVHPTQPLLLLDYLAAVDGRSLLGLVDLESGALLQLLALEDYAAVTVGAFTASIDPEGTRLHLGIGSVVLSELPGPAPAGFAERQVHVGETVDWPLPAGFTPESVRLEIAPPGLALTDGRLRWTVPAEARGLQTLRLSAPNGPAHEWLIRVAAPKPQAAE